MSQADKDKGKSALKIHHNKEGKCFICGIDKEALEKKSLDLKTHYIQQNHKLWNYVFYLYYLDKQPKKTGLQEMIQGQISGK